MLIASVIVSVMCLSMFVNRNIFLLLRIGICSAITTSFKLSLAPQKVQCPAWNCYLEGATTVCM